MVNCVVLMELLVFGEFFGYVCGVFIGVECDCRGVFEEVLGGIVFFDEIGDLYLWV